MPHYLFETEGASEPQRSSGPHLAAWRFPEVAVEHRYAAHGVPHGKELWVCRAPSEAHVHRWAAASDLELAALRHVDDVVRQPRERPAPSAITSNGRAGQSGGTSS